MWRIKTNEQLNQTHVAGFNAAAVKMGTAAYLKKSALTKIYSGSYARCREKNRALSALQQLAGFGGCLPFKGSPRICLEEQFALNEVNYVVVRMLQKTEPLRAVEPKQVWVERLTLTFSTRDGTVVRFERKSRVDSKDV